MASWLKAAEDLFDVVDRKAKVVVSELSNDTESPVSSSSGQDGHTRKTTSRSKEKGQLKTSSSESSKSAQSRKIKRIERIKPSASDQTLNNDDNNNNNNPTNNETNIIDETKDTIVPDSENKIDETPVIENKIAFEKTEILNIESSKDENIEADTASDIKEGDLNVNKKDKEVVLEINQEKNESEVIEVSDKEIEKDNLSEKDQLNEAQGLLKTAVKTGKSKEARLARVCAGLSSRLQEYKSENSQLEELLIQERERCGSYEANIKQLEQELSVYKLEASRSELNMSDALLAKNTEIEALHGSIDALKKQVSNYEAKMASLQEDMESNKYSRELTETRVIQALREEVATAERRAEDERIAHNATKKAAVEREVELEHRAVEASNALARIQRASEESTSRASELEHKIAMLEVECASLHQQMQEMETKNRRAQKKPSEDANQLLQAWQEEVERARQSQREAENKISSLEAELQKMRVEMAGMKRDAEHYSRHEHVELEKRYRELTDLLYHKQTQLETMASEKAALEFQLEKELKRVQEAQVEAERTRAVRRIPSHWEEDTDIRAFDEPLPLHHRHIAAASQQLHKAAKILDSGAVRATRFLWRYPVARVILLFYLVFVHLFLMYLMHRLQEREVAALGMSNSMP